MKIGIVVFAYNRSQHLQDVLNGLQKNRGVSKLYIFQDGLMCERHRREWEKTQMVIRGTKWCKVIYHQAPQNKGLAKSIVDGINMVFKENDAVIVLEDDCVPHPIFMDYMTGCLEKYRNDRRIFSVNGHSWPADVRENGADAYFIGRISSWGWGTWKDRWELYEQDYKIIGRIKNNPEKCRQLSIWGQDLESMLLGNMYGKCDSWAVFWALKCIEQGGLCPTPYYSLIDNIGFDGTGTHCGNTAIDICKRKRTDMKEFVFPESIQFPLDYEYSYIDLFKWTPPEVKLNCYNKILLQWNQLLQKRINIAHYFEWKNIKRIAIWGSGNLCKMLIKEGNGSVEIKYVIESKPSCSQFEHIPVISPDKVTDEVEAIVIIPVYDIDRIKQKMAKDITLIGLDEMLKSFSREDDL